MNREEIKRILPHREPMLLVDEITRTEDGETIGTYTVTGEEWFLMGHFPGNPIVPGVILCEMAAQSSAAAVAGELAGKTPVYTGINNVKFRKSVRPGDTVVFHCGIRRKKLPFYVMNAEAYVGDSLCMSGEFSFAIL